jgi:hypothetical protein
MDIIGFLFIASIVVICAMIGLSIAALILKLSCAIAGAEVPDTGKAIVTCFLESIVGALARWNVIYCVGYVGQKAYLTVHELMVVTGTAVVAIAFIVPAGIYMPMLRVSFGRGLLIALLRFALTIAAALAVAYILVAMMGTKSMAKVI